MKFGQILVCSMTNISNLFLAQCWRLETSSRPIYDFIKIKIWQDPVIFSSWHLPFLNVPYSPFQENEALKSWQNWLLSNWIRLLNWKRPVNYHQSLKLFKRFIKFITLTYIYPFPRFGDLMGCGSKDIFKNAPCVIYLLWRHRFFKSWDCLKYKNLSILRMLNNFPMK